jgi:hypothetical protein
MGEEPFYEIVLKIENYILQIYYNFYQKEFPKVVLKVCYKSVVMILGLEFELELHCAG